MKSAIYGDQLRFVTNFNFFFYRIIKNCFVEMGTWSEPYNDKCLKANSYLHAARSTEHGSILIHTSTYRSCVCMIKYIVFNGKVEICSTREFSSVLRAECCVLRAACKCESNNVNSLIYLFVRAACCV